MEDEGWIGDGRGDPEKVKVVGEAWYDGSMIIRNRGKSPVSYHATISLDWDQNDSSTYDPDYVWEGTYASSDEALSALQEALPRVAQERNWPHGYNPCICAQGPRGGMYGIALERTVEHPSLQASVDRIRSRIAAEYASWH